MKTTLLAALIGFSSFTTLATGNLPAQIQQDYQQHLGALFTHFHQNPELSHMETQTAKRLAKELRAAGFDVTEGVGKTGVVAMLKNGPGPLVMMRADMDGLPVEEKSGLPYASKAKQTDWDGNDVHVMHACGHDVHITSLVGTARRMAAMKDNWSGTLMLVGQPAEERVGGAKGMMEDNIWGRFGQPDYALAFHVSSEIEAGKIELENTSFELDKLIVEVAESIQTLHTSKPISLQFELDSIANLSLESDALRIRQILSNLIGNAYKFTEKGYIKIKAIYTENQLIEIQFYKMYF